MEVTWVYPDGRREEVAQFVPDAARRVLDVGCDRGAFGEPLVERGMEVWGIDINEKAVEVASRRLTRAIAGPYPEALGPAGRFDCITFNDVLEHLIDPAAALDAARSHLTPSGCVLACIPNVRHATILKRLVLDGRWDYQDVGLMDRTHLRWFTKATMREMFEKSGYRVELQVPVNVTRMRGKAHLLRLIGGTREEFLALQYVIRAYVA